MTGARRHCGRFREFCKHLGAIDFRQYLSKQIIRVRLSVTLILSAKLDMQSCAKRWLCCGLIATVL